MTGDHEVEWHIMVRAGDLIAERYALDIEVASGGMGRIFRAFDTRSNEQVAVKMLFDMRAKARERFMLECAVLAEIRHPGVVRYIAHGTRPQGESYLVMEWLEGKDLGEYLRGEGAKELTPSTLGQATADIEAVAVDLWEDTQDTITLAPLTTVPNSTSIANTRIRPSVMSEPLPVQLTVRFARRLASAVAELHRRQFIHCDIKPANLFLPGGAVEQVKLIDLGTVKHYSGSRPADTPGRLSGTPYYMAPEQARATGEHTPATDIWAIGCVLYQCLVGMRPFVGEDLLTVMTRIVVEDPTPLHELRPDVPDALTHLIMSALAKEPAARQPDARAFLDQLMMLDSHGERMRRRRFSSHSDAPLPVQPHEQADELPGDQPDGPPADQVDGLPEDPSDEQADSAPDGAEDVSLAAGQSSTADSTRHVPADVPADIPADVPADRVENPVQAPAPSVLTEAERRVTCLLFVDAAHIAGIDPAAFQALVESHGSHLQRLADGTRIITIAQTRSPSDQAARAARLALKLRAQYPEVAQVLVTGRLAGRGHGTAPLGPVLDSAVRALRETSPGVVQIDSLTASLLDTRFFLQRTETGARLRSERPREVTRTLLGKAIRLVGRERELKALTEVLRDSIQHGRARAMVLTGGPGIGKSRLHQEFVRGVADQPMATLVAHADAASAGSAFAVLTPALRRMAGIVDGEPEEAQRAKLRDLAERGARLDERATLSAYIGELARVAMPDSTCESLASARRDPMFMGQLMSRAWVTWLKNQCAERPLLIAIDDLQWADLPSMQYLWRGLLALEHRPLLVVAFARPEVRTDIAGHWPGVAVTELAIEPLPHDAGRSMCRQALGGRAPSEAIEMAVEMAGGNALYLEELIRTIALKQPRQTSENLLGMLQERLDGLGQEAKRVLRAASIYGTVFWQGGIESLLGNTGVFNVSEWLDDLALSETILRRPVSRMPGDIEFEFRSGLTRDGAYAMLVEEDRALGHRLAGAWLERSGESDPVVLAGHFQRGARPERAAPFYQRAAVMAMEGNDLDAALGYADKARECGAHAELLGQVCELQAAAYYWRSDYPACERHGREALEHLVTGSSPWLDAAGNAIVSCYRQGARARGDQLLALAESNQYLDGAHERYVSMLCRAAIQLLFDGRRERARPLIERVSSIVEGLDAEARARLYEQAELLTEPDFKRSFLAKEDARQILDLAREWLS